MTETAPDNAKNEPARYTVPIVQVAARLKLGRQSAYDVVLRGELDGIQKSDGRWYVTAESLEKLATARGL